MMMRIVNIQMVRDSIDIDMTVVEAAQEAGLRYVSDSRPGIRRVRRGKGFSYVAPNGEAIPDPRVRERIASLAIPPAWTDVWICRSPNGHLQATGRDERGRKQYRYHPKWREVRDEAKFDRMIAFGRALPAIRERTEEHLALRGLPREKVLAAVVRLLETTLIRVGNEEYVRQNGSYGLTTLQDDQVDVGSVNVTFEFVGKGGKEHHVSISDPRLARIVRGVRDLPGELLFQYRGSDGEPHPVRSEDVNAYLSDISGDTFTAKDFRTWAATVLAACELAAAKPFETEQQARAAISESIASVAARLGNTPAICRKCYVHPHILNAYLDGSLAKVVKVSSDDALRANLAELSQEAEESVLACLEAQRDACGRS